MGYRQNNLAAGDVMRFAIPYMASCIKTAVMICHNMKTVVVILHCVIVATFPFAFTAIFSAF